MVVQQQLKLSIEESHSANDGHAQGGSEKQFVEHLFLLVAVLGLRQIVSTCSSCYKPEWSENRPARPIGSNPSQRSQPQRFAPLQAPGNISHLTRQMLQAAPKSTAILLQSFT